ncbi:MAG: lipoprotein signal peptidase [Bacteroidota bacterium]|nr:lipoprotein signal peptidase [Bacteroidota bacterium]
MKPYKAVLIIVLIIIADQALKIWVKTHMMLDEEIFITNWFRIHFAENKGMAFSMELPGVWGKALLGIFRSAAAVAGTWYVIRLLKQKAHWGFIAACCSILAGAIGNLIDGAFYGLLFTDSYGRLAQVFPAKGYAGFMQGQVVDMLRFPLFHGFSPNWLPLWGGQYFEFFNAVFNISDAAITVGVFIILIFQKTFFKEPVADQSIGDSI